MELTKEEMDSEIIKDVCKDILEDNKEELRKALLDQIINGESIIHQKEDGTIRAINPMSPEGCEIHSKYLSDNQVMEADVEFTQKDISTALENFKPKRNFLLMLQEKKDILIMNEHLWMKNLSISR